MAMTDIWWNGSTVWVNDSEGCCIGRFSRFGVDVHHSFQEQVNGKPQCLDCAHDLPPELAWPRFVLSMASLHGVIVPEEARPSFCPAP